MDSESPCRSKGKRLLKSDSRELALWGAAGGVAGPERKGARDSSEPQPPEAGGLARDDMLLWHVGVGGGKGSGATWVWVWGMEHLQ